MKINKLRLKGFIGIQRGLGLEEIEIDFSDISGLVAFDGMNGAGKSTVLENLHPYNTLASRSGALFNHVYTRNAEKELSFTYQGNHYRTLLKIDCQSGKSEGFIWKNGISEVNGKITAYAKYITALLGSERMFFASVFCAQNSAKLSDMTSGELKSLLAEFLNLDKLATYEADAKEKIIITTGQIEQVDKQLFVLNNKLAGYEEIKDKLVKAMEDRAAAEASQENLKQKRVEYQADLELLRDKKAKQEVLIAQKSNIEAQIANLKAQLFREQNDADTELNALRDAYKSLQEQIKKNEELLKQADEINAAAEREKEVQTHIDGESAHLEKCAESLPALQEKLNQCITFISENEALINKAENNIASLVNDPEITNLQTSINQAKTQIAILEKRDQSCQSSTCSFIVAALKSQDEIVGFQTSLADKLEKNSAIAESYRNMVSETKEKLTELYSTKAELSSKIEDINSTTGLSRKALATLRFDLTKVKGLAGKKTTLAVAQTQYDNITRQMEENVTKGKELSLKWESRKSDLMGSISDAQVSLSEIKIDNEIDRLIGNIAAGIGLNDSLLSETETSLNSLRSQIMKYEADLSARAEVEKDIAAANVEKSKLQQDISDWTYLRNSCGKNGLQAMEIDSAAPVITGFANDLLTQAFGPIFTVKLRTLNEDGKECLDIIVINDDGEEILLDNLSGGQRVWVLMALRLGMTLLSKEKSGHAFESFYADELDGALDPDNANNFVNMYRAFMASGRFEEGFFISHKPSCRSLADNILMFDKGKAPYWN